ncbi:response regulator [Viscerimonas tarda]
MKNLKFFQIVFFLLFVTTVCGNDFYQFKLINSDNGLYNNQVRRIVEGLDGRMIVKTDGMISLYDASSFQFLRRDLNKSYIWTSSDCDREYIDPFNRLWIKDNYGLSLLDLKTYEYIYDINDIFTQCGVNDRLLNFFLDEDKNAWLFTERNQLFFYDWKNPAVLIYDGFLVDVIDYGSIVDVTQMGNNFYFFFSKGGMRCFNFTTRTFLYNDNYLSKKITPQLRRYFSKKLDDNNFLVLINGDAGGLFQYNIHKKEWSEILSCISLYDFTLDKANNLWATSRTGLWIYNFDREEVAHYTSLQIRGGGEIEDNLMGVCRDSKGGMWLATFSNGLLYYHPNEIVVHPLFNECNFANAGGVRTLLSLDNGDILCGMYKGVLLYSPSERKVKPYLSGLNTQFCMQLMKDSKGRIWLSTLYDGIYCIDKGKISNYRKENVTGFVDNNVRFCYESLDGTLYICNELNNLGRFDPEKKEFTPLDKQFPQIKRFRTLTHTITFNEEKMLVASQNGIFFYDFKKDELYTPRPDRFPEDSIYNHSSRKYNCNFIDSRGLVWFGTQDGLNVWNPKNNATRHFFVEDGLPNNCIQTVTEDPNKDIWVATSNGIVRIRLEKGEQGYNYLFFSLNHFDGVQHGEILERSALAMPDGMLYFGGMTELNGLNTNSIAWGLENLQPVFVRFSLFNRLVNTPISSLKELRLNYDENYITLEFSALNYVNPSQTYYKYRLKGLDEEWLETQNPDGLGKVTYTALSPGKYTFEVYAANTSKHWGKLSEIDIIIRPPFWATWWAYLTYILFTASITGYGIKAYTSKKRGKLIMEQEELNRMEQQKLDEMKFRFFTNISHEFRTPLTLIIIPLEVLLKKVEDLSIRNQLKLVHQSAQDLLNMVNQLLDFRRLEQKGEHLNVTLVDVPAFLESIYLSFGEVVSQKNIRFELDTQDVENTLFYFDQEKMHKVMNNLLSNAFKFTPDGGKIGIHAGLDADHSLVIAVEDSGVGIEEKDLSNVFTRFYQTRNSKNPSVNMNTGSGIGLHLVKEYIELHKGSITVESKVKEGSSFVFFIPDGLSEFFIPETEIEEHPEKSEVPVLDADLSVNRKEVTLLVVEDNDKFREYLVNILSDMYNVIPAADGLEGLEMAQNYHPDLIISDVMMPRMDGLEMCKEIKTDIELSHIPVILLTAKKSPEYRTSGYEVGADSYISKPFNLDTLLMRITKLLEQREKRKETFIKNIEVNPKTITITSLDEQLIAKALECVEKNMSNTEFSVESLSKEVGMDRTHLYRKMQSIIGQTPSDFIRTIRMKRAASLLSSSQLTVSEISLMVGFNTQKYFSNYFKEMFNMTPSQYAQMKKGESTEEK